ncbi:MAG TPA: single-stranded DNA-binding protein [Candidatus Omnitrophica bacterium]|nr:single-stranded DNA-binding protein [Candidatus Omnitrophota bacterium]
MAACPQAWIKPNLGAILTGEKVMASLNKVLIIGNLTRDPELRYTPGGTAVANLRMAVNRRYKDKAGEVKQDVCYMTVVAWDKQAEVCNQYLHKGSPLFVEGRLQSRSWDGPDGKKRNVIEIRAEKVQFLGSSGASGVDKKPQGAGDTVQPSEEKTDSEVLGSGADDVSWGQDMPEDIS